jgi:hypothetical protein
MKLTVKPSLAPNRKPYNRLTRSRGNCTIHLPTEAEAVTVLQLIVLLALELARLNKLQTGETGAAAPVIEHALQLLKQIGRPDLRRKLIK